MTDTAYRPVAGATVELVGGAEAGKSMMTAADGRFTYSGVVAYPVAFRASKDGYVTRTEVATNAPGATAWVFIQLETVALPVDIAGEYTLTLIADSVCAGIPNELRTRSYPATIALRPDPAARTGTSLMLTAGGATFLPNYNGFPIGVAGNDVGFSLYYKQEDFALVEQSAAGTFLAVQGSALASVGTMPVSTMSAPLDGIIDYCAVKPDTPWTYDCNSGERVAHERCQSRNHRLILTRR